MLFKIVADILEFIFFFFLSKEIRLASSCEWPLALLHIELEISG